MTPDERALRDAFLAEMWPVVRQHHEHTPRLSTATTRPRKACPVCGTEMAASNLSRHVNKMHASSVDKAS